MFLKNRNISSKIKRSKVTDYAALNLKEANEHPLESRKSAKSPYLMHVQLFILYEVGLGTPGGTLIFSAYVDSDPASTVHPPKISEISNTPKKYLEIFATPKKYSDSVFLP